MFKAPSKPGSTSRERVHSPCNTNWQAVHGSHLRLVGNTLKQGIPISPGTLYPLTPFNFQQSNPNLPFHMPHYLPRGQCYRNLNPDHTKYRPESFFRNTPKKEKQKKCVSYLEIKSTQQLPPPLFPYALTIYT